ncbi:hypothetical protein BaRGS_00039299 [Batillaria attramentaria]|uniref:Uncharacterized protein n=1 Tax=Batillaria attramentaria TaxID=370345 RepID=A0ABD0J435_9CAEN
MNSVHDTIMGKIELAQEARSGSIVKKTVSLLLHSRHSQEAQSGNIVKLRDGDNDSDSDEENRPRAIIVRFVSRKSVQAVLSNRRKLKNSRIVITEDLTVPRYQLLMKCRNHEAVENAWSSNGKILVKATADNKIREIKSVTELMTKLGIPPRSSTPLHSSQVRQDFGRRQRHFRGGRRLGDSGHSVNRSQINELMDADTLPKSAV